MRRTGSAHHFFISSPAQPDRDVSCDLLEEFKRLRVKVERRGGICTGKPAAGTKLIALEVDGRARVF